MLLSKQKQKIVHSKILHKNNIFGVYTILAAEYHFIAGKDLSVEIAHVRRKFYVASNSIIARSHGLAESVGVQLINHFACLYWRTVLVL